MVQKFIPIQVAPVQMKMIQAESRGETKLEKNKYTKIRNRSNNRGKENRKNKKNKKKNSKSSKKNKINKLNKNSHLL